MMVTLKDVYYRLQEIADDAFHHGEVDPDEIQELINSVGKTITSTPASEDEKRVEALKLWQRWFEESDSPFYASEAGGDIYCFFCREWQPNYPHEQTHETDCIYLWQQPVISCDPLRRAERVGAEQVRDALTEAIIICERWEDES